MTQQHGETAADFAKAMDRLRAIHQFHFARLWAKRHDARTRACVRANIRGQKSARAAKAAAC